MSRDVERPAARDIAPQLEADRRGASWFSIGVVAIVPALALFGISRFAEAQISEPLPVSVEVQPVSPVAKTPLLSVRRVPDAVATEAEQRKSAAIAAPYRAKLRSMLGEYSCAQVVDPDGGPGLAPGAVLFSYRQDDPLIPASNEKLYVASTALAALGGDYAFHTEVRTPPIVDGVIDGPVFIIGGGDPVLTTNDQTERTGASVATSFDALMLLLVDRGVTRITGPVVGVDTRYDAERRVESWGPNISVWDVGPIGALVVNDGQGTEGVIATDPAKDAAERLIRDLSGAGVTVGGGATSVTESPELAQAAQSSPVLFEVTSPPLNDILAQMLALSDNHIAEMLLRELGFVKGGAGTRVAGAAVIEQQLTEWHVASRSIEIADGSGLSRANRSTCDTLSELLATTPVGRSLGTLLPIAGRTGTMADYLVGTPAEGSMRAKTGTLTSVKALTGVQPGADGKPLVFSIILNGPRSNVESVFEPTWAALAELLDHESTPVNLDRDRFTPVATPVPDAAATDTAAVATTTTAADTAAVVTSEPGP